MTIDLDRRIDLLSNLGGYMEMNDPIWLDVMDRANHANAWFTMEQIILSVNNITTQFLKRDKLKAWAAKYHLAPSPKTVGIVMAGNIPLVGFHDFICGFISGHYLKLKLSSKDDILIKFLIAKLGEWEPDVLEQVTIAENLKGCDAYIATGSNNSSRYFEQYFAHVPHIIRRNRTSVAVLDGQESPEDLALLADDVFMYFGLGCRNVTQVCVPAGYDFAPLLRAFRKYDDLINQHKYKNNFDYHLSIYLLNRVPYMDNEMVLMVENDLPFSAVSVLHYRYYTNKELLLNELNASADIQAIIGKGQIPFGTSQSPALCDYADNIDTMDFLCRLGR